MQEISKAAGCYAGLGRFCDAELSKVAQVADRPYDHKKAADHWWLQDFKQPR